MDPALRFEISQVEALKQDKSDKEDQNKIYNGSGIMFKTMIQSPMGLQSVEKVIFDIPLLVVGHHLSSFSTPKPTTLESGPSSMETLKPLGSMEFSFDRIQTPPRRREHQEST